MSKINRSNSNLPDKQTSRRLEPATVEPRKSSALKNVFLTIFGVIAGLSLLGVGLFLGYYIAQEDDNDNQPSITQTVEQPDFNDELPEDLDYKEVEALYDYLKANYDGQLDYEEVLKGLKKGLIQGAGDPHTVYVPAEELADYQNNLHGVISGIGARLDITDNNDIVIVSPIKDSPAAKAGLLPQDIIVEVDDRNVQNLGLVQVVNLIRGQAETKVKLTISRNGNRDLLDFVITRAVFKTPSATWEIANDIGILSVSQFIYGQEDIYTTFQLMYEAALEFKKANVKGVVLDLRNNPGGHLDATWEVASLWLDTDETVVRLGTNNQPQHSEMAKGGGQQILKDISMVILINGGSASAAEILAAALQYHQVGQVVGEKSFGKDSVQSQTLLKDIPIGDTGEKIQDQGLIKITSMHWFTPAGKSVEGGIAPDVIVTDNPTTIDDEQLQRAIQLLNQESR